MSNTTGFRNLFELQQHYADHGVEVGADSEREYLAMADALWVDPKPSHIQECRHRRDGDLVRYDPRTERMGVVDNKSTLRTFFKPIPCSSITAENDRALMKQAGKCHPFADNTEYFRVRCGRQ